MNVDFSGCFFSTTVGELRSYENPKNKITAVPATEEEIWGAKFMVRFIRCHYIRATCSVYQIYVQRDIFVESFGPA